MRWLSSKLVVVLFPFPGSAGAMTVWFNEAGEQVKCNWDDSDYE